MTGEYAAAAFAGTVGEYLEAGRAGGEEPADAVSDQNAPPVVFVDSSALIALADAGDASHQAAVAAYRDLVASGYRLFTIEAMIGETFDLLRAGPGLDVAREWLRGCRLAVYHATEQDVARAKRRVLNQSGHDGISLNDAISLVVMDRLGVTDVFAVDQSVLNVIS